MDSQSILLWLDQMPAMGIYIVLFFSSILENVFPPWPGDTLIVVSGFLAARGQGNIFICLGSIVLGNLTGASLMYFIGERVIDFFRHLHGKSKISFVRRALEPLIQIEGLNKAKNWFARWGIVLVLFSRFSAGIRFFVSIAAGIVHMRFVLFLICFTLGVLLWSGLLLYGGWLLKESWNEIIEWIKMYNVLFFALLFASIFVYFFWKKGVPAVRGLLKKRY